MIYGANDIENEVLELISKFQNLWSQTTERLAPTLTFCGGSCTNSAARLGGTTFQCLVWCVEWGGSLADVY